MVQTTIPSVGWAVSPLVLPGLSHALHPARSSGLGTPKLAVAYHQAPLILLEARPPPYKEVSAMFQEGKSRSRQISWGWGSELTQYFCHILSMKASQKASSDLRDREIRLQFLMVRVKKNLWPFLINPMLVPPNYVRVTWVLGHGHSLWVQRIPGQRLNPLSDSWRAFPYISMLKSPRGPVIKINTV